MLNAFQAIRQLIFKLVQQQRSLNVHQTLILPQPKNSSIMSASDKII